MVPSKRQNKDEQARGKELLLLFKLKLMKILLATSSRKLN